MPLEGVGGISYGFLVKNVAVFFSRGFAQIHADRRKKPFDNNISKIRVYPCLSAAE
jgi:hypothetical protein